MASGDDHLTVSKLAGLDRSGREAAYALVRYAREEGLPVIVTSGRRDRSLQAELIRQGLTSATQSRHLSGRAFDLGFQGYQWQQVPRAYWQWLGSIWESMGGRWGGRFTRYDPIHFDW